MNQQDQLVRVHRLGDVVIRPGVDRFDSRLDRALAGKKDKLRIRLALLPQFEQLNTAHIPHIEIAQDHVDIFIDVAHGLVRILSAIDGEAFRLQQLHHGASFCLMVFDHEHSSRCTHWLQLFMLNHSFIAAKMSYVDLSYHRTRMQDNR